jgi:hypothetical protein
LWYELYDVPLSYNKHFARLNLIQSGFFMPAEKFSQLFLPGLCQNHVFHPSSNRGGNLPCRARSPPPFLGAHEAGKERGAMKKLFARLMARLLAFSDGHKNNLNFLAADFAKIAFSTQVVYEGIARFLSAGKEVRA